MSVSGALRSFTKRFRNAYNAQSPVKQSVVGVAGNIDHLLDVIDLPTSTTSERVTAAGLIRSSIDSQAISSVQEVWYSTRSLLDLENPAETRQAGWRLTISCIEQDDISASNYNAYYRTIIEFSNVEDFHLILVALKALTQDGRRIGTGHISIYHLPTVLISWIQLLAIRSQELRGNSAAKDISEQWGHSTAANFHDLLAYCSNTLKFNMTIYEGEDIEHLLQCITAVCRQTSSSQDIKLCCGIIDNIMAFGIIPVSALQQILEVLCGLVLLKAPLGQLGWKTIENLTKSHLGNSTFVRVCHIVESHEEAGVTTGMRCGAVRVLEKLFYIIPKGGQKQHDAKAKSTNEEGLTTLPVTEIMNAYGTALSFQNAKVAMEIANSLAKLLSDPAAAGAFDYDLWLSQTASPFNLVCMLGDLARSESHGKFGRMALRRPNLHSARSTPGESTGGIVPLDTELPMEEDINAPLVYEIKRILNVILKSAKEKDSVIPIEEALEVAIALPEFLNEDSCHLVVEGFKSMHYCSPYFDGWEEKLDLLLNRIYKSNECSPAVRVQLIGLCRDVYGMLTEMGSSDKLLGVISSLFGVLKLVDEQTAESLLKFYKDIAVTGMWSIFEQSSSVLVSIFPDQSSKKVFAPVESALGAKVAATFVQTFLDLYEFSARRARYLYYALVQVCKMSKYDDVVFREAFALLCRLRANASQFIFLSEPVLEGDYGKMMSCQVPLEGLSKCLDKPSLALKRSVILYEDNDPITQVSGDDYTLDTSLLLSMYIGILQNGAAENVFALVLINLPTQLSNVQMFTGCDGELVSLRNLMYAHVGTGKPLESLNSDAFSKHDVLAVEIHILTMLLGYSRIFQKPDHDKLIQTLVLSMNQWDKAANWAIHCLVVCCYECPSSVQRFLPQILSKFQTKISSTESSTHILEFLLTLSLVESFTGNFNLQEFKRVFGICFTYIQHANDILTKSKTDSDTNNSILSQYLLRLAHCTIEYLYLAIEVGSRPQIAPYLIRSLLLSRGNGTGLDPVGLSFYDFISRFTYSDKPLNLSSKAVELGQNRPPEVDSKRWLLGASIVEVSADKMTGDGTMVFRRPTGTVVEYFQPAMKAKPLNKPVTDGIPLLNQAQNYSANYWLMQMMGLQTNGINAVAIPNEPQYNRAIATLDRAPVVDFHKVGIIYIARGQESEAEILSNTTGSAPYRKFLKEIGSLIKLRDNKEIYTGGLDTENDSDGEFTYGWRNRISQIIFHVTTMMPNRDEDQALASKKRHIGNNFVNIYFDESGTNFKFDTVKSQFNFINIAISPSYCEGKYRVRAYRKHGLANVLAAYERKVISEDELALFVRHLALKASLYASVYNQHGEYTGNWLYRLDLIEKLKERLEKDEASKERGVSEDEETGDPEMLKQLDFTSGAFD